MNCTPTILMPVPPTIVYAAIHIGLRIFNDVRIEWYVDCIIKLFSKKDLHDPRHLSSISIYYQPVYSHLRILSRMTTYLTLYRYRPTRLALLPFYIRILHAGIVIALVYGHISNFHINCEKISNWHATSKPTCILTTFATDISTISIWTTISSIYLIRYIIRFVIHPYHNHISPTT